MLRLLLSRYRLISLNRCLQDELCLWSYDVFKFDFEDFNFMRLWNVIVNAKKIYVIAKQFLDYLSFWALISILS